MVLVNLNDAVNDFHPVPVGDEILDVIRFFAAHDLSTVTRRVPSHTFVSPGSSDVQWKGTCGAVPSMSGERKTVKCDSGPRICLNRTRFISLIVSLTP